MVDDTAFGAQTRTWQRRDGVPDADRTGREETRQSVTNERLGKAHR